MKECEGCGFWFLTERGHRGNYYMIDHILHVCDYCGHQTIVEFKTTHKSRPS